MPQRPATDEEKRLLGRVARPHPLWIAVSARWPAAMLCLTALGLYYLATGARTARPVSGLVLSLRPEGEFLAPSAVRPLFSEREHARGRVPEDGDVLETDFDRLRRRA